MCFDVINFLRYRSPLGGLMGGFFPRGPNGGLSLSGGRMGGFFPRGRLLPQSSNGRVIMNLVPCPNSLSAFIVPCISSTIPRT